MMPEQGAHFGIVATMGPACQEEAMILALLREGATGFRFPFAKETPEWQVSQARRVRKVASKEGVRVARIMDLPGGQPRTENAIPIVVAKGEILELWWDALEDRTSKCKEAISIKCSGAITGHFVALGDTVLLGDGEIAIAIESIGESKVLGAALGGGVIRPRAGLTVEGRAVIGEALSSLDIELLSFVSEFDMVLWSFVHSPAEIIEARKIMKSRANGGDLPILAVKIETISALRHLPGIVEAADVIVVARGDLMLATGAIEFFSAQENVIFASHHAGKPVWVATQIVESVGRMRVPNRAEISDLSALVSRGVNGIVLAAETTIGENPVLAVGLVRRLFERYRMKK